MTSQLGFTGIPSDGLAIVEGTVSRIVFADATKGFAIVRLDCSGVTETVKGTLGAVRVGDSFRIEGHRATDRYGAFINPTKVLPIAPQSVDGVARYLAELPGLGDVLARRIVEAHGNRSIDVLCNEPARLRGVVGLSAKKIEVASEAARARREEQELLVWLYGIGLSPAFATRVLKVWGAKAPAIIKTNAYRLAREIPLIGFALADSIARNLGIPEDAIERREAAILHVLGEAASSGARYKDPGGKERSTGGGHCYLPRVVLADITAQLLTLSRAAVEEAIGTLVEQEAIVVEEEQVYSRQLFRAEHGVAERIATLLRTRREAPPAPAAGTSAAAELVKLSDEQRAAVELTRSAAVVVITGGPGTGKCLGRGTPVLMFDGRVVSVEDVREGDVLMGPDSRPRRVLSTNQGRGPLYQITPIKGSSWVCNDVHILTLVRSGTDEVRDIALDEYLRLPTGSKWRQRAKLFRAAVEFPVGENALCIKPYHLGVLIGDGSLHRLQLGISKPDPEIEAVAREIAGDFGVRLVTVTPETTSVAYRFQRADLENRKRNPLGLALERLGLLDSDAATKFIPDAYKTASRADRLALLAGLIDTDGHLTPDGCTYDWISASARLANDLAFVARSVGLATYVNECEKGCQTGAVGTYYRVSISGDTHEIPCRIPRKRAKPRRQIKDVRRTGFSVAPIGEGEYFGFTLDGDGRFLLGDFTVTHNTTTMKAVVALWTQAKRTVLLCAPTGRAAKRLAESTGKGASTIHRLLEWEGETGAFKRNAESPLSCDLVVVDESSMLDTPLARSLLAAIPQGASLLLVGDVDQLPSVGAGQVLHDVIESGQVPVARLSRIFRQREGSEISEAAASILRGEVPRPGGGELSIVPVWTPEADGAEPPGAIAQREVVHLVSEVLPRQGFSSSHVQVLTPMHKGQAGTQALNKALQAALNPNGAELRRGGERPPFRVGDPVLQTKNDYDLGVMNGDLGRVVAVDPEKPSVTSDFYGTEVTHAKEAIGDLELAYAMSVHKSQGGEYPCVVMVLLMEHFMMLRRNLLYTGVTRGKKRVVIVGAHKALGIAVRTRDTSTRYTGLRDRIRKAIETSRKFAASAAVPVPRAFTPPAVPAALPSPVEQARRQLEALTGKAPPPRTPPPAFVPPGPSRPEPGEVYRQIERAFREGDAHRRAMAARAMQILAGRCDGAQARDGSGFNAHDTERGHELADIADIDQPFSDEELAEATRLARRYHRQLPADVLTALRIEVTS